MIRLALKLKNEIEDLNKQKDVLDNKIDHCKTVLELAKTIHGVGKKIKEADNYIIALHFGAYDYTSHVTVSAANEHEYFSTVTFYSNPWFENSIKKNKTLLSEKFLDSVAIIEPKMYLRSIVIGYDYKDSREKSDCFTWNNPDREHGLELDLEDLKSLLKPLFEIRK